MAETISPGLTGLGGLAIGPDDTVYVVAEKTLARLAENGTVRQRAPLPEQGRALAVGPKGIVYVALTDRVVVYSAALKELSAWPSLGKKAILTSVALGREHVYIADAGNKVVLQHDRNGNETRRFTSLDKTAKSGRFHIPSPFFDVLVEKRSDTQDEVIWVAHTGAHRLEAYSLQAALLSQWGRFGMDIEGFCGCCNPVHVAKLSDGSFVTSEKGVPRVKVYSSGGAFKGVVAAPAVFKKRTQGLDLAVDSQDRVYVLDPPAGVIRVYTRKDQTQVR